MEVPQSPVSIWRMYVEVLDRAAAGRDPAAAVTRAMSSGRARGPDVDRRGVAGHDPGQEERDARDSPRSTSAEPPMRRSRNRLTGDGLRSWTRASPPVWAPRRAGVGPVRPPGPGPSPAVSGSLGGVQRVEELREGVVQVVVVAGDAVGDRRHEHRCRRRRRPAPGRRGGSCASVYLACAAARSVRGQRAGLVDEPVDRSRRPSRRG